MSKSLSGKSIKFSSILDKNKYSSPFKTWCEIQKIYKEDKEDKNLKYINAGKIIEPKIIKYLKDIFSIVGYNVIDPSYCYSTYCHDYFKEIPIFGGKWDALL